MSKKLSFSFEKPYDEIEIDGNIYKLYFDDESIKRYRDQASKYQEEVSKYLEDKADIENMSKEEQDEVEKQGIEFSKDFIETFCGEGSFDSLYSASGNSMLNFMPLIEYIFDWLNAKMPAVDDKKKTYYTKKAKNK